MEIDPNYTLCFTGHRPSKLYGYNYKTILNKKMLWQIRGATKAFITKKNITNFISGMALGIDLWSALIVLALKKEHPEIKLICAIPCKNQYKKWKKESIQTWKKIVNKADLVYYVSAKNYTKDCMQKRNEWMVDNSKYVLSVWDGSKGGTANCIKYAIKKNREIINFNPKTFGFERIDKYD